MTNDVEKICVKRVTLFGKIYLKTSDNVLYDPKTKKEVGTYDPKMNIICEIVYDDEDEQEDNESGRVSRSWGRLYLCRELKVITARKWRYTLLQLKRLREKISEETAEYMTRRVKTTGTKCALSVTDKDKCDPYNDFVFPVFQDDGFM